MAGVGRGAVQGEVTSKMRNAAKERRRSVTPEVERIIPIIEWM